MRRTLGNTTVIMGAVTENLMASVLVSSRGLLCWRSHALVYLMTVLLLAGCASTKVTAYRDTAYAGKSYYKIMVAAPDLKLEPRQKLEKAIVSELTTKGALGVESIGIMQPTRSYTDQDFSQLLNSQAIDAVLVVDTAKTYKETTGYTAGSTSTYWWGGWRRGGAFTLSTPSEAIVSPRMEVEFRLVDVYTNQTAWMSSTFTAGNAYATLDTLCNSLAAKITEKLKDDGMLASAARTPSERKLAESERPQALPKSEATPVSLGQGGDRAKEALLGRQSQQPVTEQPSQSQVLINPDTGAVINNRPGYKQAGFVEIEKLPSVGIKLPNYNNAENGIIIEGVYPGSPAAKAGLKAGDKIVEKNGEPVKTLSELQSQKRPKMGDMVEYKIIRTEREMTFSMKTVPFADISEAK